VAFITTENIDYLVTQAGFDGPIGLLSIDVDGNDYRIWRATSSCRPDIITCEYDGVFAIAYLDDSLRSCVKRFKAHCSGQYFGASLPALKLLAARKGYTFIGTNLNGINAFFVKDTLAPPILALLSEPRAFPKRLRVGRDETGALVFHRRIQDMYALISDLPVLNVGARNLSREANVRFRPQMVAIGDIAVLSLGGC